MRLLLALPLLLAGSAAWSESLVFDNGRVFVAAEVNGVATEALLDSGAEASLVDDDFAKLAKLPAGQRVTIRGSGGEQQATIVPGVSLSAFGLTVQPEAVVVMDLGELSERLIRRPTNVVLGREIFDARRLRIDIRGGTVTVVSRKEAPPGVALALTDHAGIESIPVSANGLPASAEFDLGNGSGVLISRALANRLGLKVVGQKRGGGIGRELLRDVVRIDRLEVAGITFSEVEAEIDDQTSANDLNIGTLILKNFLITTDFEQRRIWLAQTGGERG